MRAKPEWWVRFRDEKVREKWTEEIKEQQKDMHRSLQLTNNMVRALVPRTLYGDGSRNCGIHTPQINYVMGVYDAFIAV